MLHRLWTALTGWHSYQLRERDSYRGRFFTRPEEAEYHDAPHFYLEIPHAPRFAFGAEVCLGGEDKDISGNVSLGYRVFWGAEKLLPRAWRRRMIELLRKGTKYGDSRSFQLELRSDPDGDGLYLCVDIWREDSCMSWDDNKKWPWQGNGWHFMVDLKDLLLGETKHLRLPGEVEARNLWINMPEGRYPARMIVTRELWLRERILSVFRRWPKVDELLGPEFLYRATVIIPGGGIPEPGKGENSWDLDDEATQEITLAAEPSFPDRHAVSRKICDLVMRRRHSYGGGFGWKPDAGWPSCVVPYGEERDFPAELERIGPEAR
jgi:hypothetical protein